MSAGAMARESPRGAIPSPYRGLAPFRDSELDAHFFFGRERESEIIGSNLLAARLTVLYGASGVGKSSLLRAGVAQSLRRTALENVREGEAPEFVVVVLDSWTENPSASLTSAMVEAVRDAVADTEWEPSASAAESLVDVAAACGARLGGDLLLVLDQFEEYFLYHPEAPTSGFGTDLSELVRREDLPVRILIGIREDSLAKLDAFKARIPNLFANFLRLDPLDREAGRAAILARGEHAQPRHRERAPLVQAGHRERQHGGDEPTGGDHHDDRPGLEQDGRQCGRFRCHAHNVADCGKFLQTC